MCLLALFTGMWCCYSVDSIVRLRSGEKDPAASPMTGKPHIQRRVGHRQRIIDNVT